MPKQENKQTNRRAKALNPFFKTYSRIFFQILININILFCLCEQSWLLNPCLEVISRLENILNNIILE